MAKLVFGMNQSLDGYVDHDAFAPSPTLFRHFIEEARGQVGSVYGRRMYEVMRYWDDDQPDWGADERDFAAAWRAQPKWVVSRTLKSVGPNATLVGDDLEAAIRELKASRDGEIEVAGPSLAHSLTELGLIDEYRIYLHPVVLGRGKPYFAGPRPPLHLARHDRIDESVVRMTYVPARAGNAPDRDDRGGALRMDNILLVVEDLEPMVAFFAELGLEIEGRATVEGPSVDRLIGLEGTRSELVTMRTPDGHGRIELDKYHAPGAIQSEPVNAPVNTIGLRRIMFAVRDLDAVYARLRARGAELIGDIVQHEDAYRLCYLRGPEGIIVALAEQLKP